MRQTHVVVTLGMKLRSMGSSVLALRGQKAYKEVSRSLLARLIRQEYGEKMGRNGNQNTENLTLKGNEVRDRSMKNEQTRVGMERTADMNVKKNVHRKVVTE